MRVALLRFWETAAAAVLCSAVTSALFACGLFNYTVLVCTAILGAAFLLFAIINIQHLCGCWFDMRSKSIYYAVNLPSYAAFAAITLCLQRVLSPRAFTWIFGIFKVFSVATAYGISNFRSALMMHGIMFLIILLVPFAVMLPEIEVTDAEMLPLVVPGSEKQAENGENAADIAEKTEESEQINEGVENK